jgi:hypothetical protein
MLFCCMTMMNTVKIEEVKSGVSVTGFIQDDLCFYAEYLELLTFC